MKRETATPNKRPAKSATVQTAKQLSTLSAKEKSRLDRVAQAVSAMRSKHFSLQRASRAHHVSPRTVKRWASSELHKNASGKWAAKKSDSLMRILKMPTQDGLHEIAVRGSRAATQVAKYSAAVHRYLRTGDASRLDKFRDKFFRDVDGKKVSFLTDHAMLDRLSGLAGTRGNQ